MKTLSSELRILPKDRDARKVLNKIEGFNTQWEPVHYNFELIKYINKLHTRKYRKGWANLEHLMIRDPIRKKRRKAMDSSKEELRKIKNNLRYKF